MLCKDVFPLKKGEGDNNGRKYEALNLFLQFRRSCWCAFGYGWAKGQKVLCLKRKQLGKPTCCFCVFTREGVKVSPEQSLVSNKTNAY